MHGFHRVAACVPELKVADSVYNAERILCLAEEAASKGAAVAVFPELCVTGYTCGDLFYQERLLAGAYEGVARIAKGLAKSRIVVVIGAPFLFRSKLYNCAFVVQSGRVLGAVPKSFIPNCREFYEKRWFASGRGILREEADFMGAKIPFGTGLIFSHGEKFRMGVEVCEDLWAVLPPSSLQAIGGATLLVNLSASNALVSKAGYRKELVRQQSARCVAAYVYSSAGVHESSTDLVFGGHAIVAENGATLAESERFRRAASAIYADLDFDRLVAARISETSFQDASLPGGVAFTEIPLEGLNEGEGFIRELSPTPFVPSRPEERNERCAEIFHIQTSGLAKRLEHTGAKKALVGVSGGLDSTLALLVAAETFKALGRDAKGIVAVTMPGFGTTGRTYKNAVSLMKMLGADMRRIDIRKACMRHFADIGHAPSVHDVTYENVQARERTQILMDVANREGGIVIGTGDLSEIALGWSTYNGDHMSMYAVNAGVPKTLIRYLIGWVAENSGAKLGKVLADIMDTPVSPELLPKAKDGKIHQRTEDILGPYELHDFFLYHTVKYGAPPDKLEFLASYAFAGRYGAAEIKRALGVFIKRLFSQQFKRSCMPDGPKVGSICMSPRGDWRMPSDASPSLWIGD